MYQILNRLIFLFWRNQLLLNRETDENFLEKIEKLLDFHFFFFNGYLFDYNVEQRIREIGKLNFKILEKKVQKTNRVLHIGTTFFETGGHSRVVDNWIKNDLMRENHIVLTRQESDNQMTKSLSHDNLHVLSPEKTRLNKAQELIELIRIYDFDKIILHTHWNDTIPFLALSVLKGFKIIFYNHTPHCGYFGYTFCNFLIDISPRYNKFNIKYRGVAKSFYLPIPTNNLVYDNINNPRVWDSRKKFLSIGSSYKFKTYGAYNFSKDMSELFKKYPAFNFLVIGYFSQEFKANKNIETLSFQFNTINEYQKANFFVDSYPVGSGLAILDAIKYGCIPLFSGKAITIFNLGSLTLFKSGEIPNQLVCYNQNQRINLFRKISENKLNVEQLQKKLTRIIKKHENPIWIQHLNRLYQRIEGSEIHVLNKKHKLLYKPKVAKFCVLENRTTFLNLLKESMEVSKGIKYRVLNILFNFFITR